jgi:hypothetical protein
MRKLVINPVSKNLRLYPRQKWLDLEEIAAVEVTSEDPNFPIESALALGREPGWRAAESGEQVIRIILDAPIPVRRIRLDFSETDIVRTQQFTLRWSQVGGPLQEIVRQQWNFSPQGSTSEVEDYQVDLDNVSILELILMPDLSSTSAIATLAAWRVA